MYNYIFRVYSRFCIYFRDDKSFNLKTGLRYKATTMAYFMTILALVCSVKTYNSAYISLKPLKIRGLYQNTQSYFLSPEKIEIIENDNEENSSICICDIIPLPVSNAHYNGFGFSSPSQVCSRDTGLYDCLPYQWGQISSKKILYDFLCYEAYRQIPPIFKTPSHTLLDQIRRLLGAEAKALLVEVVDENVDESVKLGACLVLSRVVKITSEPKRNQSDRSDDINNNEECYVKICLDELVHLSVDLDVPILMDKQLYQKCSVDAMLINKAQLNADDNSGTNDSWSDMKQNDLFINAQPPRSNTKSISKSNSVKPPLGKPIWEIYDTNEFLRMSVAEKRELLRRSGITNLPRPREGAAALDALLTDNMDSAVRAEYFRRQASSRSSTSDSSSKSEINKDTNKDINIDSESYSSNRQVLLQQMAESLSKNDMTTAIRLRDEFALLTSVRADPTQDKGSYDPYLDQDDWYMAARRKAMASKNNK